MGAEAAQAAGLTVRCFAPLSMTTYWAVADCLDLAGNSADYETNPIVRQAGREAGLPPNFLKLALPPAGEAGAGAGFLR